MLNAIGNVIMRADGRYKGTLRTVSIKANIDILPTSRRNMTPNPTFA
jgi:uncharacterized protein (DUF736 family)